MSQPRDVAVILAEIEAKLAEATVLVRQLMAQQTLPRRFPRQGGEQR